MRIIGYSSIDKVLVTYPGPEEIGLSQEVALVLKKRGCAGTWDGERYIGCDSPDAPFCSKHSGAPDTCVACRGTCLKQKKTCTTEHSVYLAVFSPDIIKVGVSKSHRLERRLHEQGADLGFEIARFPDGELARRRERDLATAYTDRLTFEDKLKGIASAVDAGTLQKIYSSFDASRVLHFKYFNRGLWMRPIVLEPREEMAISGRVMGVKGQTLVLEKSSTIYAINLDGLVGYDIELGKGMLNLQTSLFEYAKKELLDDGKL